MTYVEPAGVKVQGNISVVFAPTGSLTAPSLAVINGASALDISGYLTAWNTTATANRGNPPRRLGSTKQYESFGTTTESIADLTYVVQPQAVAASAGKKAFETLLEGVTGYLYERLGLPATTAWAVGQFCIVRPVVFGPQNIMGDPSDEFAEFMVTQPVALQAPGAGDLVAVVS